MQKLEENKMNSIILILLSVVLGVFGQISLKQGLKQVGKLELRELATAKILYLLEEKFILLGIFLYIFATLIWLVVLSQEEISFAYPLVAIGYIIVAILGKIFFDENLSLFRIIGILLIVFGVYFITIKT
jgi:multidrug transporter EmrE-like cation transporter